MRGLKWCGTALLLGGLILFLTTADSVYGQGKGKGKGGAGGKPVGQPGKPGAQPGKPGGVQGGMQAGGAAVNQGIGQVVSRLARSGIHGQQLAAIIHQMKGKGGPGKMAPGGKPAGPANVGMKGGKPGGPQPAPIVKPKPGGPQPAPIVKPKPGGAAMVGAKGGKPK